MTAALGHFNPYLQKLRALRAREGTAHRYNRRDPESHRIHQAGAWPVVRQPWRFRSAVRREGGMTADKDNS